MRAPLYSVNKTLKINRLSKESLIQFPKKPKHTNESLLKFNTVPKNSPKKQGLLKFDNSVLKNNPNRQNKTFLTAIPT